jgi:hypothetical protein
MRQRVAAEAARIIAEQGLLDFGGARRKAVARLRVGDRRQWPDNAEIALALETYRAVFQADGQVATLDRLRRGALLAMELLTDFAPRLVGAVRDGSAGDHSPVTLHLTADSAKNVAISLLDQQVPLFTDERRLRFADGSVLPRPVIRFAVGDVDVEAVLLEPADRSRPPLDPVSGKPDRGLGLEDVRASLDPQPLSDSGTKSRLVGPE